MKRSGYMILEMLCVLGLLGVFGLISSRLFQSTVTVWHGAAAAGESAMRFDSAMAVMREDVFLSDSTEMPDSNSLVVHQADDNVIRWQAEGSDIQRISGDAQRSWSVGQKIQLRQQGKIVLVQPVTGGELAIASALEIGK